MKAEDVTATLDLALQASGSGGPILVIFSTHGSASWQDPGGDVAETSSLESAVGKFVGAPVSAALGAYLAWLTAGSTGALGSALVHVVAIGGGICGLAIALIYSRNLGVLGAGGEERDTPERQAYEALRKSLAEGNLAARLYTRRLTAFLDAVDRFFGDALHLGQRAFGLRTPAPLWTAPSLDRCLLLALFYPITTIILIWAISGHVGPAEQALWLPPNIPAWRRFGAAALLGFIAFAGWRSARSTGSRLLLWLVVAFASAGLGAYTFVLFLAFAYAVVLAGALIVVVAVFRASSVAGASAFVAASVMVVALPGAILLAFVFAWVFGFVGELSSGVAVPRPVALAVVFIAVPLASVGVGTFAGAVQRASDAVARRGRQGAFLSIFLGAATLACLAAAVSSFYFKEGSAILLFVGLLTLLNAPFDWASLGLTRALLRRGLELAGWWPYALALADAALAVLIIAALALTMLVGVQAFNALAVYGGGARTLPLEPLFKGLGAHPSEPEYWWLYALLLSTMIPSLVNLVIGGASLLRGIPGLPALLLAKLPVARAVPAFDRAWIATVLTLQTVGGGLLGIAAQVLLVWVMIGYIMPFFGPELLEMAQDVAAFNLPARVGQLFGVSL